MTAPARPLEGKLLTPFVKFMLVLWAIGTAAGLVRFTMGLGAATAMNDGYPWGLWIAFDVVVGTGLASGGYALALVVFILNRGRYHPLVRPALLTSGARVRAWPAWPSPSTWAATGTCGRSRRCSGTGTATRCCSRWRSA